MTATEAMEAVVAVTSHLFSTGERDALIEGLDVLCTSHPTAETLTLQDEDNIEETVSRLRLWVGLVGTLPPAEERRVAETAKELCCGTCPPESGPSELPVSLFKQAFSQRDRKLGGHPVVVIPFLATNVMGFGQQDVAVQLPESSHREHTCTFHRGGLSCARLIEWKMDAIRRNRGKSY